ncbi:recombinase family protein [Bradyrhizobium valentinum]|uniref:recombinase family protein n=1 Tax=Bradyrhizobium valentinum TaxID=1518501 RepID=UPI0009EADDDF
MYARVSSAGQDLEIQLGQLKAAGCERLFFEKVSGMKESCAVFDKMLKSLAPGDVVVVAALDRLTRVGPFRILVRPP